MSEENKTETIKETGPPEMFHLLNDNEEYEFKFRKQLDPDVKLDPPIENQNTPEKRQKLNDGNARKRIRKLVVEDQHKRKTHQDPVQTTFAKMIFKMFFIAVSIGVVIIAIGSERMRNELFENYEKHYNMIMHGTVDYCNRPFDPANITIKLNENLVGQQQAIDELTHLFESHSEFTSIALIGNTGVGKTYATKFIGDGFQWPDNVNTYIWTTDIGTVQYEHIKKLMDSFSECGHNILFIDDLSYEDRNYILTINEVLKQYSEQNSFKVITIYVFNLNKNSEMSDQLTKSHADTLRLLKNINIVEFNDLTRNDILRCVDLISESRNISLTDHQRHKIMESALVGQQKTGCKNVLAKVYLYASEQ